MLPTSQTRKYGMTNFLLPPPSTAGNAFQTQARLLVIGSYVHAHCWHVAKLPVADESQNAHAFTEECAGKGLAVALGSHRLGSAVDLLVATGDDAAGDQLLRLLHEEGLHHKLVQRYPGPSGHGAGLVSATGECAISVYPGANSKLDQALHLPEVQGALAFAHMVYAQLEAPLPCVYSAFVKAKQQAGTTTILNPSPWQALPQELLEHTDILIVNRHEAISLLQSIGVVTGGAYTLEDLLHKHIDQLWPVWPGTCLMVTLGDDGCVAFEPEGGITRVQGHSVDTSFPIGAGDAFSAGLCHGLLASWPIPIVTRWANACGALAASKPGILTALPSEAEVREFLSPAR